MKMWYLMVNGNQIGPIPANELIIQGMRSDSLVWCEGMSDWAMAGSVSELAPYLNPSQNNGSPQSAGFNNEYASPKNDVNNEVGINTNYTPQPPGNPQQFAGNQYGGIQYGGQQYGGQQYGGNQYAGQQYSGDQYGGQQYGGNQYGGQQYGGQQYGGNRYSAQPGYNGPFYNDKSNVAAGLLAVFLGIFGVHYFYCNKVGGGFICLGLSLITCGAWEVITLIQGIVMFTMTKEEFLRKYVNNNNVFPIF